VRIFKKEVCLQFEISLYNSADQTGAVAEKQQARYRREHEKCAKRGDDSCVGILLLCTGCSNELDKAIKDLGGDKAKQEQAMATIKLSAKDPIPKLVQALKDKSLSPTRGRTWPG